MAAAAAIVLTQFSAACLLKLDETPQLTLSPYLIDGILSKLNLPKAQTTLKLVLN